MLTTQRLLYIGDQYSQMGYLEHRPIAAFTVEVKRSQNFDLRSWINIT